MIVVREPLAVAISEAVAALSSRPRPCNHAYASPHMMAQLNLFQCHEHRPRTAIVPSCPGKHRTRPLSRHASAHPNNQVGAPTVANPPVADRNETLAHQQSSTTSDSAHVPISEPWIPRSWLANPTPALLRSVQLAAQLLQQRLPKGGPAMTRHDPISRGSPHPPSRASVVQQLAAGLQAVPSEPQPEAAAEDALGSSLQQLRHQLGEEQWADFVSTIQSAAAAALASSQAAAHSGASSVQPAAADPLGSPNGASAKQQQHKAGAELAHYLHDNRSVPLLASLEEVQDPTAQLLVSLASIEEHQDPTAQLLVSLASMEEDLCDALGEVHGYGRSCTTPGALTFYHPGYGPIHQELSEELQSEEGGQQLYRDLPPHLLESSWYGHAAASWADPTTAAGWRRHQQHHSATNGQEDPQQQFEQAAGNPHQRALQSSSCGLSADLGQGASGASAGATQGPQDLVGQHLATPVSTARHAAAADTVSSSGVQPVAPAVDGAAAQPGGAGGSPSTVGSRAGFLPYEHLVFGGGGARCLAYAGALHNLRQLGVVGRLKSVSGASGGAVYALLAAMGLSVQEVLDAVSLLPDHEPLSWWQLNSRLGLTDGEATFAAIHQAIAKHLGKPNPTLGDVAAATGVAITLTATSLARRGPVYLSSAAHPDMPVMEALRGSCAIPLLFAPVRGPGGDLLVDGCISDCTPIGGLAPEADPARVLVLAVHDAGGLEAPDLTGLLSGLVATCMQAGYHHIQALGVDVLNLWPSVASVNPLNFRVPRDQARDVVAASQALAEAFAVQKMSRQAMASDARTEAPVPLPVPAVPSSASAMAQLAAAPFHQDLLSQVAQQSSLGLSATTTPPPAAAEDSRLGTFGGPLALPQPAQHGSLTQACVQSHAASQASAMLLPQPQQQRQTQQGWQAGRWGVGSWWGPLGATMQHGWPDAAD